MPLVSRDPQPRPPRNLLAEQTQRRQLAPETAPIDPATVQWDQPPAQQQTPPQTAAAPARPRPAGVFQKPAGPNVNISDLTLADLEGAATTRPLMPAANPADPSRRLTSVVYLCDGSGSMMGKPFDMLKVELKEAIESLAPDQSFNVVFFQRGSALVLSQTLVPANQKNKD